jgi:hypothetical protein
MEFSSSNASILGPEYSESYELVVLMNPNLKRQHVYEVRPRKDKRGVNLISDVLPFGRLWYGEPNAISNAIGYAKFDSRST